MAVTEAEIVDLLTGVTRVHLAIVRGLSENHPRSAENVVRRLREEARLAEPDGVPTLNGLAARLLLEMLEAKPLNTKQPSDREARRTPLQLLLRRTPLRSVP
ncbi:MAG TPA: hypothetical protein VMH26_05345 [Burkholderiales bacterium]|nr:hypothetical protein [Burkholderiales bacterium]